MLAASVLDGGPAGDQEDGLFQSFSYLLISLLGLFGPVISLKCALLHVWYLKRNKGPDIRDRWNQKWRQHIHILPPPFAQICAQTAARLEFWVFDPPAHEQNQRDRLVKVLSHGLQTGDGETGSFVYFIGQPAGLYEGAGWKNENGNLKAGFCSRGIIWTRVQSLKQIYDFKTFFSFSPKQNLHLKID